MEERTITKRRLKLGWSLIPVLIVIIVLVGLALKYSDFNLTGLAVLEKEYAPKKFEVYTFQDVYREIKRLDGLYGTDYHEEGLVKNRVAKELLQPLIDDLTKLYDAVDASQETPEKKWLLKFIEARKGWLESQVFLEKALRFGKTGIITTAFQCENNETVLLATYYYNQTLRKFHKAEFAMDDALFNIPEAKEIIGVGENKPKIYDSPEGGEIAKTINTNIYIIDKYCRHLPELIEKEENKEYIYIT